ncbi:GMC family oxidoreductase [Streptomyces sp. FIT100]|uniref:GMC family oxidoreductase n=1 Tax=Streptomyces sp. FIT100 TaxID=2837956 RepID=UPI0021CAC8AE|nr:GMC family oxidoreductase N-terminal domain-containing protein [Streptomyces sp. FIT100]UUN30443.1 GMC family oxidoreductase N-terminal domain-containing protein [Streptomyces sp. FIT100]
MQVITEGTESTESYDFVVVGGGTAGSVVAARLSENDSAHVLLLEAGGAQASDTTAAPPAWPALLETSANWGDTTVPQPATGTSVSLARGRVLGGGSSINAMTFARGHRSSYDAWPADGANGWGFDDLLPYFKRSENAPARDPALRGVGGPLTVGPAHSPHPVVAALLRAATEIGYRRASDVSGGLEEGFGWTDLNIVDGRRQSAADAYLAPALHRPNLTVVTGALVHRLQIRSGRCAGVEYSTGNGAVSVGCSGEVVLTAGTIGSAQLLMLSGIGPQAHLREAGVEVVLDLPGVGANLHDHPIAYVVYNAARPVPAGVNNHGEAIGLVRSRLGVQQPDLQVLLVDAPGHMPSAEVPEQGQGYTIGVSPMRPRSRGTVRLASAEPGALPVVDPNYFGDDRDLTTMVAGLRLARRIGQARAVADWRGGEVQPGPDVDSDAGLRAYVRRTAASYMHPVGTCRIGADALAVVDADLRVRGVGGLRVADASVLPSIPSANIIATVYAVAERAADMLRS